VCRHNNIVYNSMNRLIKLINSHPNKLIGKMILIFAPISSALDINSLSISSVSRSSPCSSPAMSKQNISPKKVNIISHNNINSNFTKITSPNILEGGISGLFNKPLIGKHISEIQHIKTIKKDGIWNKLYDKNTKSY